MLDLTASSLASSLNVPHLVARIAVSRGIKTVPEFHALLYGKESSVLDPFSMFGMKEAVEWILKVKENHLSAIGRAVPRGFGREYAGSMQCCT